MAAAMVAMTVTSCSSVGGETGNSASSSERSAIVNGSATPGAIPESEMDDPTYPSWFDTDAARNRVAPKPIMFATAAPAAERPIEPSKATKSLLFQISGSEQSQVAAESVSVAFGQLHRNGRSDWYAHNDLERIASESMSGEQFAYLEEANLLDRMMGMTGLLADKPTIIRSQVDSRSNPTKALVEVAGVSPSISARDRLHVDGYQVQVLWEDGAWKVVNFAGVSLVDPLGPDHASAPSHKDLMELVNGDGWRPLGP